jgi:hypothetical protein
MSKKSASKPKKSGFSNAWTGYAIILAHLVFVVLLAMAMIFIQALSEYLIYVLVGGLLSTLLLIYLVYRKMKRDGRHLIDNLQNASNLYGHDIRIELLGGMAAVSISHQPSADGTRQIPAPGGLLSSPIHALPTAEEKTREISSELLRLAALYEQRLIDRDEFEMLKKNLLTDPTLKQSQESGGIATNFNTPSDPPTICEPRPIPDQHIEPSDG